MACTVQGKNGNCSCHGLESSKIEIWQNGLQYVLISDQAHQWMKEELFGTQMFDCGSSLATMCHM